MNQHPESDYLRRAAQRANRRTFFVASALSTYQNLYTIDEAKLATFLGCSRTALPKLALCRRPDPEAPDFRAEVERIASHTGVGSESLAQLLREVESTEALRSAQPYQKAAPSQGALMAARDRIAEARAEENQPPRGPRNRAEETSEPLC